MTDARPYPRNDYRIPKSVTVREFDPNRVKPAKPRNLLEECAMCPNRDLALSVLKEKLGITSDHLIDLECSDAKRWRQLPPVERLREIGNWLRAEAYELMDFVKFDQPANMTIGD